MWGGSPVRRWNVASNGSNKRPWGTAAARATRLYTARRALHTDAELLTDKHAVRLTALFTVEHGEVEATWAIYQRLVAGYRHPDRAHVRDREQVSTVIDCLHDCVPENLAVNGRLTHLSGSALGFAI